jgi:hypothetical protein
VEFDVGGELGHGKSSVYVERSVGAAAGCDLLFWFLKQDQKIAACGSSYWVHVLTGE